MANGKDATCPYQDEAQEIVRDVRLDMSSVSSLVFVNDLYLLADFGGSVRQGSNTVNSVSGRRVLFPDDRDRHRRPSGDRLGDTPEQEP